MVISEKILAKRNAEDSEDEDEEEVEDDEDDEEEDDDEEVDEEEEDDEEVDEEEEEGEDKKNWQGEEAVEDKLTSSPQDKRSGNLDKFGFLSKAKNTNSRVDAAVKLLKHSSGHPGEAAYTLKRLIRGLASPVESSRQSFFVCLVEFLRQQGLEFAGVKKEVAEVLKVTGTRGEESVYLLGQILADIALLRAGTAKSKVDRLAVLHSLVENGSKRTYLNLIAIKAVIDNFLSETSDIPVEDVISLVGNSFKLQISEASLDSLLFILSLLTLKDKVFSPEFLSSNFGFKDISKKSNLAVVQKILLSTTLPLSVVLFHPTLESLADLLCERKIARRMFGLIHPDMVLSTYKGHIGATLLRNVLKLDPGSVEELLTLEVLETLRSLCGKGVLNPVQEIIDLVAAQVTTGTVSSWTILSRILDCCVTWDKHVPGNLVSLLIQESDQETLYKVGELLENKFKSDAKISERICAAGLIAKLIGHPKVIQNVGWRAGKLSTLLELTVISVPGDQVPPLTKEAKFQLKDVFYRGLDSNCKTLADNVNLVHSLMKYAVLLVDKRAGVPLKPIKGASKEAWDKVVATVNKLGKSWSETPKKETGVFLLLFSHIGLQVFCQPEMAVDVLSELLPVYSNWSKAKPAKGDPAGIEVVVEIMLSLLAQNKHLLRKVVNCIFKVIADQLTEPALLSILEVVRGGDEAEEDSEDEGENEADGDDEEDEDDDVEEPDSEEEESGGGSEDEDDEKEKGGVDQGVLANIKKALGDHAEKSEAEDSEIDMDDIPDEEMQKLDEKLVEAFRALGGKKSGAEKKKEKLDRLARQHFKLRVLDLVEIYLHHRPQPSHVFLIIQSLLDSFKILSVNPAEEQVYNKIKAILKKCSSLRLHSPGEEGHQVLQYLLQFASFPSSAIINLGNVHARLCLTALRVNLPEQSEQAEQLYLEALNQFFTNNQCMLSHEVFQAAVGIPWAGAIAITKEVAEKSFDPNVKHYRKAQGLAILSSFLKNKMLENTFADEKTQILKNILEKVVANLSSGLEKGKPKQLLELFTILRGLKQQRIMSEEQVSTVQHSLRQFAESAAMAKQSPAVKKSLKKLLSFFNLKVNFGKLGKPAEQKKVSADSADDSEIKKKKKKKKKKNKSKEAEKRRKEMKVKAAEAEDAASTPSFSKFLIDTTQVFKEMDKKNKKRKTAEVNSANSEHKKKKKKVIKE